MTTPETYVPPSPLKCKICFEREKSAVFSPCSHVCACLHCATQCNQCPICRVPILKKKNHFVKPLLCFGVHLIRERWRGAFGFYSVPEH